MCTVTHVPNSEGFLFTSNRDEAPSRSSSGLVTETIGGKHVSFPRDQGANGTWIAVSDHDQLVCVLNGGFVKHNHRPPYRLSRGIMALDFFGYDSAQDFINGYAFEGLEPFTLVIHDRGRWYDLHWDETSHNAKELIADEPHIWSSCTLYNPALQRQREKWFSDWLNANQPYTSDGILHFHHHAGTGDPENDVVMNRGNVVRTTSITHVRRQASSINLRYNNLLSEQVQEGAMDILRSAKRL